MITIYGAGWCKYCQSAKKLAIQHGLEYVYKDVDDPDVMDEMRARVPAARAVPQIFFDDEHVGGYAQMKERLDG